MRHCLQCGQQDCTSCQYDDPIEPGECDELLCIGCDQAFDANGYCAACDEYSILDLQVTVDPDGRGRIAA